MGGQREISLPKVDKNIYIKMELSHTGTVSLYLLYARTRNKHRYKKRLMRMWGLKYRRNLTAFRKSIRTKLKEKPRTVKQLSDSMEYNYADINQALHSMRRKGWVDRRPLTSTEATPSSNTCWIWYLKE